VDKNPISSASATYKANQLLFPALDEANLSIIRIFYRDNPLFRLANPLNWANIGHAESDIQYSKGMRGSLCISRARGFGVGQAPFRGCSFQFSFSAG
jgi:hypothetical protein